MKQTGKLEKPKGAQDYYTQMEESTKKQEDAVAADTIQVEEPVKTTEQKE